MEKIQINADNIQASSPNISSISGNRPQPGLIYKHEQSLFIILVAISGLFWLCLILGTLGIALAYVLLFYVFFLFVHSGFISYLKGNGVRVTEEQYPDLYNRLLTCCDKVGLKEIPETYILRTDFFNALATRFLGRHFVVLFTDVLDALQGQPAAVNFYIGHEIGHIHRKHLLWSPFLIPGKLLPVLGAAHRRAEEYTCDRYGAACCENRDDVKAAIATIAAGDTRWKDMNLNAYLRQVETTNGFWMSFHEITGEYPWLTKRMATALAFKRGEEIQHPRRHRFAWFLSMFIPNLGGGGLFSLMLTVAIIGILAAIALPAYQDYTIRVRSTSAYNEATTIKAALTEYVVANNQWPTSLLDLGYKTETISNAEAGYSIGIFENGVIGANVGSETGGEDNRKYVVLEPSTEDGEITWSCYGSNLEEKYLPSECRGE